jgi:hypothetical protein
VSSIRFEQENTRNFPSYLFSLRVCVCNTNTHTLSPRVLFLDQTSHGRSAVTTSGQMKISRGSVWLLFLFFFFSCVLLHPIPLYRFTLHQFALTARHFQATKMNNIFKFESQGIQGIAKRRKQSMILMIVLYNVWHTTAVESEWRRINPRNIMKEPLSFWKTYFSMIEILNPPIVS